MNNLLSRAKDVVDPNVPARFQRFNLTENPFPSEPAVNKASTDRRINGDIYEAEIRTQEFEQIRAAFLAPPHSDPNHLRIGYIVDKSYIGRGNGKSAFLLHLDDALNKQYCLDFSDGQNKCFSVYISPEPGGRTKTFANFVDIIAQAILESGMVDFALASLRLSAIAALAPQIAESLSSSDTDTVVRLLNSEEWFDEQSIDVHTVSAQILRHPFLQDLSDRFPLLTGRSSLFASLTTRRDFVESYQKASRSNQDRYGFVFNDLVKLFVAAGFNGSFLLVDDFERIADFQSARQRRDFALELRSALFDGSFASARIGFYTTFFVLHAGVSRLIRDAWAESGMENRAPIAPSLHSKHIVPFEKLNHSHAVKLVLKYLAEYRIRPMPMNDASPFTEDAIGLVGELSEFNAAKILKMAYELLDAASTDESINQIDRDFVTSLREIHHDASERSMPSIEDSDSTDLIGKARGTA